MRTIVVRTGGIARTDRAAIARVADTPGVEAPLGFDGRPRPGEVLFPRYVQGVGTRMVRTPVDRLPAGWQSLGVSVPMRMATCEEVRCPFLLNGWTEMLPGDGNAIPIAGEVRADQAQATWGEATTVRHHPPGTPCQRLHKLPNGLPPIYTVNGRPTLWNEFEDAIGGGLHQAAKFHSEGVA